MISLKTNFVISNKNFKKIKPDYLTIVLSTIFLCSVIIGVLIIKNADNDLKNTFYNFLNNYISTKNQGSFLSIFSGLFIFLILFVILEFIFGLSAVGTPFVSIVLISFGIFCGGEAACIIWGLGLKGVIYFIFVNLPCYAITAAIIVKCCCLSINMSLVLLNCILYKDTIKRNTCNLKEYFLNYMILLLPVIFGALISTIFFKLFSSLFIVT